MYRQLEGELWFHRWHMWPSSTPSVAAPSNSFVFIDTNSFSKDGRKINVGDCALFKPPHNSLPFVGRIRKLKLGKENNISLCVNWLYRPADIKLKEGASLETAPNEIFYSFHKDEIPAASLFHPCKVTFLRKGVKLPLGIPSFVCRQVYDVENERLFWLTDRNYINELQEEVDQLLDKPLIQMHGAVSPKLLSGPNGSTQRKPNSDNIQNSSSSISSHAKSKKREHGVHNSESVKRERVSKLDDADSGQLRPEHILKAEIAKISDKGGLVDLGAVEKLIQLMRPESTDKKLDLACRTMLVNVISGTDRFDCLDRFVHQRGLLVLDEWLQELHKGKISDKSVEEFLFSLLCALEKLPVNLHALQNCNIGKSVNHLRSHKNSEIQKKARSLVSTWRRRVEAEMNSIETKSSTIRGGSEVGPASSTMQPSALKAPRPKESSAEAITKSPTSPTTPKLQPSSATKERSFSPSQSPNNSPSCSSDHVETSASSVCKITSSVSRGKNSRGTTERASDVSHMANGTRLRLIVRLPNTGGTPAKEDQNVSDKVDSLQGNGAPNRNRDMGSDLSHGREGLIVRDAEQGKKDASFGSGSSSGLTPKPGRLCEPSFSSMNALVESCIKLSEASASPSSGDDGGINLLASVAARELSRSDLSPACSPRCNAPVPEGCSANTATSVKPETTQIKEESVFRSSSDMHEDEKKMVHKRLTDQPVATRSCGDVGLAPKSEETKEKPHENMDSRTCRMDAGVIEANCVEERRVKLDFDLNEGFPSDYEIQGEDEKASVHATSPLSSNNKNQSSWVTVAAADAAKGPFYPSEILSIGNPELVWNGSAANSAFRPAEPLKVDVPVSDSRTSKPACALFDFDLNVGVDEASQQNPPSGLDLDLNASEESPSSRPSRSGLPGDGPGMEEVGGATLALSKNSMQIISGNFSTWFPPNNPSQRMLTPVTSSTSRNPEVFKGPILSSSPAVAFPSTFQYSAFPFRVQLPCTVIRWWDPLFPDYSLGGT